MPWFRVDDGFDTHPKVLSIPRGAQRIRAIGLWTSLGVWCAKHLTDGRFARHMVEEKGGTQADARRLVDAGLWVETEDGYAFHEWKEQQPTREQVMAERVAAKERMREARAKAKAKEKAARESAGSEDVRPNNGGTSPDVRLPRPDPTRPDLSKAAAASISPPQSDDPTPPPPEDDPHPAPPPGPVAVLAAKMARHTVFAHLRWDGIPAPKATRLLACIEALGDAAMIDAALKAVRPTNPPTFGTGFLDTWEGLVKTKETGRHLRLLEAAAEPCPHPGHTGTTDRCTGCIVDAKVGDA